MNDTKKFDYADGDSSAPVSMLYIRRITCHALFFASNAHAQSNTLLMDLICACACCIMFVCLVPGLSYSL